MNISYRWLRDLVPGLVMTPEELGEHLALRGAPVDGIESPGAGLEDVVVAHVIEARQHPNADRLSLCTVDGGAGVVQVVCGAPNVRSGGWYPFAPVDAVLPGDFKIKKAKIRGETSQGMLCSAKELGLGVDHSGILEVEGDFTPGEAFVAALGLDDATLDVEVTANRGDLLSHVGVAREVAPSGSGAVGLPDLPGAERIKPSYADGDPLVEQAGVSVRIQDADLCPRYLGAVIRGVKVGPSPAWLQERLRGAGSRPINNVVDATNYVMLELGHPLHAFDLAQLKGSAIVVRRATSREDEFVTLDGTERAISPEMLMICDAERPVAIAGVMGGLHSEVEDATTDVLLECALFDPKSIRATRRSLVMSTDASYRFERGVDPEGVRTALERCVSLILATAGGVLEEPVLDCRPVSFEPAVVALRLARIEHLLGIPFRSEQVTELLRPLGFDVVSTEDSADSGTVLHVRVPGFRSYDVSREVDLIEEVARTHGFDAFPADLGPYRPGTVPDDAMFRLEDELRATLAARGLLEAQTPAFAPPGEGDVEVSNPLATTEPFMRRAILPALLRRVEYNFAHGNRDVRLFELGTSFRKGPSGERPLEEAHLAVAMAGRREPPHWSREDEPLAVWDLKAVLEDVVRRAYRGEATVEVAETPANAASGEGAGEGGPEAGTGVSTITGTVPYTPGLTFLVHGPDGEVVGSAGLVAEGVVDAPVWAGDVWALEMTLPAQPQASPVPVHRALPQFPATERDVALSVSMSVSSAEVEACIRKSGGKLLEHVEVFDLYGGAEVAEGARSIAYRLRFRAPDRTLKDKEVEKAMRSIIGRLQEDLGVQPRS